MKTPNLKKKKSETAEKTPKKRAEGEKLKVKTPLKKKAPAVKPAAKKAGPAKAQKPKVQAASLKTAAPAPQLKAEPIQRPPSVSAAPAVSPQPPKAAAPVQRSPAASAPKAEPVQSAPTASAPAVPPPAAPKPAAPVLKKMKVASNITVRELSEKMGVKVNEFIKKLMTMGVFATINQRLDDETAARAAQEYGFGLEIALLYGEEELNLAEAKESPENLLPRPPVVTIMGHVDHGKTSLLDAVRETKVAEKEAGGITQHIGAYRVSTPKGDIVFLDTPGHEAFTAMRARGAKATDIVVLVVSAADGVMPQTVEAIDHAKAAQVPIVVAVNKIDLPQANAQKIKQELSQYGLVPEDWGGKTIMVEVSAKKRLNLDQLLEMILLEAEILELKANPSRPGVGVILEARLDPKKGNVATLLVQSGTVKVGDPFVAGLCYGRIRALLNDRGQRVLSVGPSTPVEILGISGGTPQAGDAFNVVSDERQAKDIAEKRKLIHREESLAHQRHVSLLSLKAQVDQNKIKQLGVILKADVQGSLQALRDSLEKLSTQEISLKILHAGVGSVNGADVLLAEASDAVILGFHVEAEAQAQTEAERTGIEVRAYSIIYDLIEDVKAAMEGLLEPEIVDVPVGKLEIRQVFQVTKVGKVAGCYVLDGKVQRGATAKIVRASKVIHEGKVAGLKHFKDDVKEVEKGKECGVSLDNFKDYQKGDLIEVIVKEKRTRRLQDTKQQ